MNEPAIQSEFVQANGLRFHVRTCGAGDRLALCLHGFPESSFAWRYQLPRLATLGNRAWAPDLRGYGQTDRPRGLRHYALETLQDDVAGLIDASGAKSTVLIGHDWGGALAWGVALRRLRPLERLIILNMPHPRLMLAGLRRPRQMLRSWYILFFQLPWLPEKLLAARRGKAIADMFQRTAVDKSRFPDEVLDVYRRNALEPGALTAMLNYYRALGRGGGLRHLARSLPAQLDTPTLLLWGEEDIALGKELTYGTEHLVPRLTLRYLPGVSHWVQQEAPETVNKLIACWLTDQPLPDSP